MGAIQQHLANSDMIEYVLVCFQEELQKRLTDLQRQSNRLEGLHQERTLLQAKAQRLANAVAAAGHSPALLRTLAVTEGQIEDLNRKIEECRPINVATTMGEVRDFVHRNIMNLRSLLHEGASKAKAGLARHIGQLTLKPKQTPTGPVYEVSGGLSLLAQDVMLGVARDGIAQHYTSWRFPTAGIVLDPRLSLAISFREYISHDYRATLSTLLGAAGLVLLIAVTNVTSLLLARAVVRRHEIAVRSALGATSRHIVVESLFESLMIASLGGMIGVPLAMLGVPLLVALIPATTPIAGLENIRVDLWVLMFAAGVTLSVALLLGVAPALAASSANLKDALHEVGRTASAGRRSRRLLRALTALEAALALILTAGAGMMVASLNRLLRVSPGFQPDHVLTLQVPASGRRFGDVVLQKRVYGDLVERLREIPGVTAAGFVNILPLTGAEITTNLFIEAQSDPKPAQIRMYSVSPDYFRAMGIPLRAGRLFNDGDERDEAAWPVLVNEAFVRRYWPGESGVGKRIKSAGGGQQNPWHEVTGVVADTRYFSLSEEPQPAVFYDYKRYIGAAVVATMVVRVLGDPGELTPRLRRVIGEVDAGLPVSRVIPMVNIVEESVWRAKFATTLLVLFAGLALTLAVVGIYGTLSFVVNQSLPDVGIRLALGATPMQILRSNITDALAPAVTGGAVGLAGTLGLARLLSSYLYRTSATDPWTLGGAYALLLALALAAAYGPARRAARTDPIMALRHE